MPDVSLVTVTFGDVAAATRVGTGLEAAQRTGGDPPMEVIVVAVGPAGEEAAEQLVELTAGTSLKPEIVVLPRGCGYSQAANAGVAKTTGDIIVVAQPDVSFHQRFLRRIRIEAAEKWDFLAPAVREGEDGQIATGATRRGKTHRLVTVQTPFRGDAMTVSAGNAACVIVRRHVLEQRLAEVEGLFDPAYVTGDDLDLFWWAEKKGLLTRYVPTLMVGRAVGTEVLPTSPERRQSMANYRVTVWKHGDRKDLTGWLLGEAAFIGEEVGAGGLSGVRRYAGSWRDTVKTAQSIRQRRGPLRDPKA
jgi:hypothetical protein